ncbi:MAG: hypothetical protein HQL50_14560, partial [Magnetococcales bacterium]|nr:hypothetical protein [Magnetococcales bacterium]
YLPKFPIPVYGQLSGHGYVMGNMSKEWVPTLPIFGRTTLEMAAGSMPGLKGGKLFWQSGTDLPENPERIPLDQLTDPTTPENPLWPFETLRTTFTFHSQQAVIHHLEVGSDMVSLSGSGVWPFEGTTRLELELDVEAEWWQKQPIRSGTLRVDEEALSMEWRKKPEIKKDAVGNAEASGATAPSKGKNEERHASQELAQKE